jgi:hypothetical protein
MELTCLTAEEFVDKIRQAEAWAIGKDFLSDRLELITKNDDIVRKFTGPDPVNMTPGEYKAFIQELMEVTTTPVTARSRLRYHD